MSLHHIHACASMCAPYGYNTQKSLTWNWHQQKRALQKLPLVQDQNWQEQQKRIFPKLRVVQSANARSKVMKIIEFGGISERMIWAFPQQANEYNSVSESIFTLDLLRSGHPQSLPNI